MKTRCAVVRCLDALRTPRRVLAAGLAAFTLCAVTPDAGAQMGLGMMGGEMGDLIKPSNNARLLKQYAEILALTPDQKRTADELLVAYQTDFRGLVTRLEEIYQSIAEEAQETADWQIYQQVLPAAMVKFMKKAETYNNTFMGDLKAILDDSQAQRFEQVERLHRRKSSLKMGLDGVQKVDLFDTVQGLRLDPAQASGTTAILEQYATEMDRELIDRDKKFRTFIQEMAKLMEDGKSPEEDPAAMQEWMTGMSEAGKRIGEINTRYIPQLRAALPENVQAAFDDQIKATKYPMIYKESYADRVFRAIDKMELDAAQKEGIKTLREGFARDAAAANDKWASVMDELKANLPAEAGGFGGGMWMIANDAKFTEAKEARKALDEKAVDAVTALLTEEQKAKLPKKNYRPEWDFDYAKQD